MKLLEQMKQKIKLQGLSPDWLKVDDWTPDFYAWHSIWTPSLSTSIEVIEYKPTKPTDTYVRELIDKVARMPIKFHEQMTLYYGSTYNDFDTENAKFKASARYSFGWTDFRGIYGSPGA